MQKQAKEMTRTNRLRAGGRLLRLHRVGVLSATAFAGALASALIVAPAQARVETPDVPVPTPSPRWYEPPKAAILLDDQPQEETTQTGADNEPAASEAVENAAAQADPGEPPLPIAEPVLKARLGLADAAPPNAFFRGGLQVGDLDNDGKHCDFLRTADGWGLQAVAHDCAGTFSVLWTRPFEKSFPAPSDRHTYSYLVQDVNGDGRTDIVGPAPDKEGNQFLRLWDAQTGIERVSAPLDLQVSKRATARNYTKIRVSLAALEGTPSERDILVLMEREGQGQLRVYGEDLTLTSRVGAEEGKPAPLAALYPWVAPTKAGEDTLMSGLPIEGKPAPALTRVFAGDLLPQREGLEVLFSHAFMQASMLNGERAPVWQRPSKDKDVRLIGLGDFHADHPGLEALVTAPGTQKTDILSLNNLPVGEGPRLSAGLTIDWDGDRTQDEFLVPRWGQIYAGDGSLAGLTLEALYGTTAATPVTLGMRIHALPADVHGDYREEVVVWDEDEILIFGAAGEAPGTHPSPWSDPRYTRAVGNTVIGAQPDRSPWFNWRDLP